jgi:hypothetical protein
MLRLGLFENALVKLGRVVDRLQLSGRATSALAYMRPQVGALASNGRLLFRCAHTFLDSVGFVFFKSGGDLGLVRWRQYLGW